MFRRKPPGLMWHWKLWPSGSAWKDGTAVQSIPGNGLSSGNEDFLTAADPAVCGSVGWPDRCMSEEKQRFPSSGKLRSKPCWYRSARYCDTHTNQYAHCRVSDSRKTWLVYETCNLLFTIRHHHHMPFPPAATTCDQASHLRSRTEENRMQSGRGRRCPTGNRMENKFRSSIVSFLI
jgi:hypothetical protein